MTCPPLRIRSFHPADFEELFQIDQVCFPEEIAFSRGELVYYLTHPGSIARVAEAAGDILGFVLAMTGSRTSSRILTLDVVPEARRRRIGTALMNALHAELKRKGITVSILEVGVLNTPAQRLYEKLRYRQVETLAGYYRGKEDAYRMIRKAPEKR
jgi:ribosomal-protein-alanine N-acetyltransferase